ncbi:LemA family protein [Pseudomonas sessilinigenes]|uniref:LemA family protein n=1 Tax=Pseudomonas sessilinigenes TaxID=658629 RepID=A0ABX8MUS8_9PSED|nr:LemA family protein [Pseudomonas sessilinigenes]AZC23733.1 LemA protein [Pseudomonas sessilinigenes]QXH42722.1 LemA family protein [Pseudomonas sessilinigenes]
MELLLVAVIAVGVVAYVHYNRIVSAYNRVQRAWSDVLTYQRQRIKVLDMLEPQVAGFQAYESQLLEKIVGLRSAIGSLPSAADGGALKSVDQGAKALRGELNLALEAYPELRSVELLSNLMREVAEQEGNVGGAITLFNLNVERFNNTIQLFPGSLINRLALGKPLIVPFSDSEASAGIEYKPNF